MIRLPLKKRLTRLTLYIAVALVTYYLFVLLSHGKEKREVYHFAPKGTHLYSVAEQGIVTFASRRSITMNNNYRTTVRYSKNGTALTIQTKSTGTFAPVLESLKPQHTSVVTVSRAPNTQQECPDGIAEFYPFSLRRLFYVLPEAIAPGEKVYQKVCPHVSCNWHADEVMTNRLTVHLSCLMQHKESQSQARLNAVLTFNKNCSHYLVASGDIAFETPDISSLWQFTEQCEGSAQSPEQITKPQSNL